jgi:hypothetical protein
MAKAKKSSSEEAAQDVVFYNEETNVVALLTAEAAEGVNRDELEAEGFSEISRDQLPDDPELVSFDELQAILKREQGAGNDAVGVVGNRNGGGGDSGGDTQDAAGSGAEGTDDGSGADGSGVDPEVPLGPEVDDGEFEGKPDPNNYRFSDNEGFIENPVAGGADPDAPSGLGEFVNGVQPKGDA